MVDPADSPTSAPTPVERRLLRVGGIVQGVGFRPFIYRVAREEGLAGFVRNDGGGVTIEVEGSPGALDAFEQRLADQPPPLARVDGVTVRPLPAAGGHDFSIIHSEGGQARRTLVSPDVATCGDCLAELRDPADRRFGYPFTNCTNCGPRFTIVQDVPYDRPLTTMAPFPMCVRCREEYDDPLDRRFHAQPNACPICGPTVRLLDRDGERLDVADPLRAAAGRLAAGEILAIKGLGGYHLACDALNEEAVARLRARKHREARPFALMVPDLQAARRLCRVGGEEARLLESRRRPIVLLERRPDAPVADGVAPGHSTLGLMLPYTPLHLWLLDIFAAAQDGGRPAVLVMTSGNRSDEPIAYRDADARARLAAIADGWVTHDRAIHVRCDDSVTRVVGGAPQLLRRSRGYVPEPIRLARPVPLPILAVGGHQKNTFFLGREQQAFVSHHIGDLENLETLSSFHAGIEHFERLFDIMPEAVAYDLHPDYLATRYALERELPHHIGVQHHHAHVASVMAEHGLEGQVIGVAADGSGYGADGAIWGGEVLVAGLADFERAAHLAYVPLPGGAQAIRQPWRMAAVYLQQSFGDGFDTLDIPFTRGLAARPWPLLAQMIAQGINSPPTSSLGRLFDAVGLLLGGRDEVSYEGQAAIELEMLAVPADRAYPFAIQEGRPARLDVRPTIRALVRDVQAGVAFPQIAGRFHRTLAEMLVEVCRRTRAQSGLERVALSGGVFQNRMLLEMLLPLLEQARFTVYLNRQVPPNDGGLSLGQAAVAAARLRA